MIYLMGLGLRGVDSVTLLEDRIISSCHRIYFEIYTSISPEKTIHQLEERYGKEVIPTSRDDLENSSAILEQARSLDVCLLVTGDPLYATTHNQIRLDAARSGIRIETIENSSAISVIPGRVGLFPYRMGPPVSLPFISEKFRPRSVLEKIGRNLASELHTLLLFDLAPGRTMYPWEAASILLDLEKHHGTGIIGINSEVIVAANVSQQGETLLVGKLGDISQWKKELSPSSMIITAQLSHKEKEFVEEFCRRLP